MGYPLNASKRETPLKTGSRREPWKTTTSIGRKWKRSNPRSQPVLIAQNRSPLPPPHPAANPRQTPRPRPSSHCPHCAQGAAVTADGTNLAACRSRRQTARRTPMVRHFKVNDEISVGRDQPGAEELREIAAAGFRAILDLRPDGEGVQPLPPAAEARAAEAAGLHYCNLAVPADRLDEAMLDRFDALLRELPKPVFALRLGQALGQLCARLRRYRRRIIRRQGARTYRRGRRRLRLRRDAANDPPLGRAPKPGRGHYPVILRSETAPLRQPRAQRSTAIFLRAINAKSISAPRPGFCGACTKPSRSTVRSGSSPYFCIASGSRTSKYSQFRMARMTCRLATLFRELPP